MQCHVYNRFSTYPEEQICVGLIYFVDDKCFMLLSDKKMRLAKKINDALAGKHLYPFFKSSITNLHKSIKNKYVTLGEIMHLSVHQNGVIKVDKPTAMLTSGRDVHEMMKVLFDKYVEKI